MPDFVKDAILRVVRENLSQNGVAFISYNVYPGWKIKDVVRDLMLLAAKDQNSTEERLKAAKEALLIFKEILLAKDNEIYEKQIPLKVLLFWIDNILSKSDFYVAHEFLEEINDPFYFKDFNAMLVKNELAYLCECGLEDILAPNIGMELADSYKDKKFKDRIDLDQFIDIVSNRVFRQSLIVHAKAYESVANKQIGPSDVNKIHIVDDFIKKDDGWHDKFALMPQDISWLCEVFYKMYPASINLSQILEILPEDKLAVYSAFVRLLTNSADAMIVKDELKDIEYAPNHSRLKTNLTGYIKYFLNHKDNTDIIFANKFGLAEQLSMLDYYIFLLLDGKNTLEEITAKSLKFIKENSIKISDKNGKELKNDRLVAHIKSYVIGTAKIASMLYLLEEI